MNLETLTRRRFLIQLSMGFAAASAAVVSGPVIGSLLTPLFKKLPQVWRSVGSVEPFEVAKTVLIAFENSNPVPWAGVTAKSAARLRHIAGTKCGSKRYLDMSHLSENPSAPEEAVA
ncbi:MAG: hypothetical protein ACFUZC_02615 [Chthoniobacteraceae bacterium]